MNAFKMFLDMYNSTHVATVSKELEIPESEPSTTIADSMINNSVIVSETGIVGNNVTVTTDRDRPRSSISPLEYTAIGKKYDGNAAKKKLRVSMVGVHD